MGQRRDVSQWNLPSMNWQQSWEWTLWKIRPKNMVREGDVMPAYYGEQTK